MHTNKSGFILNTVYFGWDTCSCFSACRPTVMRPEKVSYSVTLSMSVSTDLRLSRYYVTWYYAVQYGRFSCGYGEAGCCCQNPCPSDGRSYSSNALTICL